MRLYILSILFVSLLSTGCSHRVSSALQAAQVHTTTDSVKTEDHYIYMPVFIPGDTTRVVIPVDCDSLGRVIASQTVMSGKRSDVHVEVTPSAKGGLVSVQSDCNELLDSIKVKERTITYMHFKLDSVVSHGTDTVQVKYIPGFYKWCTGLFLSLIALLLIYAVVRLYLKFKP